MPFTLRALAPALALLTVVAVRFAEPVLDGDLFWHLAYAAQMIERGTLAPDHTLYSWTPASTGMIYCAWLGELVFHALRKAGGLPLIFAFRYAVILAALTLHVDLARRAGWQRGRLFWLVLLIFTVSSYAATMPKPELLSFFFFNVLVWLLMRARLAQRDVGRECRAGEMSCAERRTSPGFPSDSANEREDASERRRETGRSLPELNPRDARPAFPPYGRNATITRFYIALPVLMLVWVNTHGGFILAAPLLAAFAIGEGVRLRRGGGENASGRRDFKCLLASLALCAAATCCTPYGLRYPAQLIADYLLHFTARPDAGWNFAYQSIFSTISWIIPYPALLVAMLVIVARYCVGRAWRQPARLSCERDTALPSQSSVERKPGGLSPHPAYGNAATHPADAKTWDVFLILSFTIYALFFAFLVRATFCLPAIFAAAVFASAPPQPPMNRLSRLLAPAAFVLLTAHTLHQAVMRPMSGSWPGFGIGGANPVREADYLARQQPASPRLVNLFNTGGYLLWRLWPRYEVMVDSRSFPYLSWFEDQHRFAAGVDFDAFLAKYPAPTAVIDLDRPVVWREFLKSAAWRPVFYGRTAAVFQRADGPSEPPPLTGLNDADIRRELVNGTDALNFFRFAVACGDYARGWVIEEQCAHWPLRWRITASDIDQMRGYRAAHRALAEGDFDAALAFFRKHIAADRDQLILEMLEARALTAPTDEQRKVIEDGLRSMAAPD